MKTIKLILGIVAIATILFTGCGKDNGGSGNSELVGTTWQLNSPNDDTYHGDVVYTVAFGQGDEVTFTRDVTFEDNEEVHSYVMTGTYTYDKGGGVAMIHNEGETTDYRITFTVSGNTLVWHFHLHDLTLTKI